MDVALRATLKEFGFKRKSRTNYVCEHSPERIWIFEIEPWSQHHPFRDWSGIFVPEIESVVTRIAPQIGTYNTSLRHPSQFKTSIIDLVKISHGWDQPTWDKNPKSRHWLWGARFPPSVKKEIPLWDGNWWNTDHAKTVLARNRTAQGIVMRDTVNNWSEQLSRDRKESAEAVGRELDALWRKHAQDWLQKCDDPLYLAGWFDKFVFSGKKNTPQRHKYAATAAIAYYVAGDKKGATSVLSRLIAETETPYEIVLEREQARDRSLELGPVLRAILDPAPRPKHDATTRARARITVNRKYTEAAHKLAHGLGLHL